jgi:hypothetical protein
MTHGNVLRLTYRVATETLGVQEVRGSNPLAPIFFRDKPFGEYVEGLSRCGDKSCAVERAVPTHDFVAIS